MISGIYLIKNSINSKIYVGSSKNITKRFKVHKRKLKNNTHHSLYLQRSWNKYGEDKFNFNIIEECKIEELLDREQYYLDTLSPEYNISLSSSSPMKGRKHSPETIVKFKKRKVVSGKEHYAFGTKLTKERIKQIVEARAGYTHTEETKNKMSETSKRLNRGKDLLPSIEKKKKKIIDSLGNTFSSMVECAKFHNISPATVCDILKGRHTKTRKKIIFKYA